MSELEQPAFESCFVARMGRRWNIAPHRHDFHELYVVTEGVIGTDTEARSVEGRHGEFIVVPAGLMHANRQVGDDRLTLTMARWSGADAMVAGTHMEYTYDYRGRVRYLSDWMLDHHPARGPAESAMLDAILATLLHEAVRLQTADPGDLADRVRRYVRERIAGPITLDDLAGAVNLSKYHFLRRFREETGRTPMRLVTQMRVEMARNLILQSDMTLDAVAQRVGLTSASYLNSVFRRTLGCTPGSLRR